MELTSRSIFEISDNSIARYIYDTLLPEIETPVSDRSNVMLFLEDNTLIMTVQSSDIISMRSALNTWLRLIAISYEIFNKLEADSALEI
ncbi:Protein of unknown function DUF2144 [Methanosalsum zhilinae DSM 4017]|uniref:KEOPS complex Pcc1-like subunit n=1 Tax=Methanosalsum zhilinae (strain DSM 4017 / NBRC 107636 / OCM 62 / WeN5) TaxID=679901 RepID=F7XLT4_METZD|nr:KEOPS complex subunit Pcc1 [Methanosalsum zhilinae]AEH61020.1 Protein of unknown function DUF2144 [Methanosalsum zhilinae DSM 4017]